VRKLVLPLAPFAIACIALATPVSANIYRCSAPRVSEITFNQNLGTWNWRDQGGDIHTQEDDGETFSFDAKYDNGKKDIGFRITMESRVDPQAADAKQRPAMFTLYKDEGDGGTKHILGKCEFAATGRVGKDEEPQPEAKVLPSEAYKVSVYGGPTAKPILDTEDKRMYRTRIHAAARERPNFAGHYIITTWGCGGDCSQGAMIDAVTGTVSMLPTVTMNVYQEKRLEEDKFNHRADNKLLILAGLLNDQEPWGYHFFTVDDGGNLKLLKRKGQG
jgi:hypothetical protein